ncbi:hypothetical protein [Aureimonas psammosilenae]|uniref:hypothetical protein n=1 Tax=Aureimonas psammosilenae TaxID=2495496 RepID=UPI001260B8E3|nr:hypothetical protein [Aureimonas psammosilenae]
MENYWEEEQRHEVEKLFEENGAARQCTDHEGYLIDTGDLDARSKVIEELGKTHSRDYAEELVRRAVDGLYEVCPGCHGDRR